MIIVNFKTYLKITGKNSLVLAKICQNAAKETGVKIIIGVQTADIYRVASKINIPVFGQCLDPVEPGRNTGLNTALALKQAGAKGVFLNHSEHPFTKKTDLEKAIKIAKKEGLKILVFSPDLKTSLLIDKLKPDHIALEEPSLVSGSKAMVEFPALKKITKKFSRTIQAIPIVGAGIKTKKDVLESLKLGAKGIAVASGIVKASNPKKVLLDFASCFK